MARIIPDAAKAAPRPDAAASPLARRPTARGGTGWYVLAFVCLAQFGVIGGWLYAHYYHPAWLGTLEPSGAPDQKPDPNAHEPLLPGEAPTIERGDELLQEGRYDLALKVYDPLAATASGALRDALYYRVGLSYEGLGRPDEALKAYRKVGGSDKPRARAAAEVGQARVLIRQHRLLLLDTPQRRQ